MQVFDDVAVHGEVRAAAQVGDVEADPAAGHEDAVDLAHDPVEKGPVFVQGKVVVVFLADVVGGRGDHEVDAGIGQGVHVLGGLGEDNVDRRRRQRIFYIGDPAFAGESFIETAGVESGRVMAPPSRRAKSRSFGFDPIFARGGG